MIVSPLQRVGASTDTDIDVADAALELALLDRPGVDLAPYREHLARMGEIAAGLGRGVTRPAEQATLLSYVLFRRHGYEGDRQGYESPANANLIDVIDRKRGLPVALAILYLHVARAAGWRADGLNVPAHLVVRIGQGANAVLQDPFDRGRQMTPGDLAALVQRATGDEQRLDVKTVPTLSSRALLVRLLNNIAVRAERDGDGGRALEMHRRMTMIAPLYTGLWWERARLEQALGLVKAARESLVAMTETTRNATVARQIGQALDELARSMN